MVHVGDAIGDGDDAAFKRLRALLPRMVHDAVAHLRREVQAATAALDDLEDAQALLVVTEETGHARVIRRHASMTCDARAQSALPRVAERRMPQVVAKRDGFGQILVQSERPRNRARDLGHFERMREARTEMVALDGDEDLRLMR